MSADDRRQTAMAFYDLMFNQCRPGEAVEQYVGDEYIQHNPEVGDHDYAGMDIFRFDGEGKIVEHWDVLQVIRRRARTTMACSDCRPEPALDSAASCATWGRTPL